MAPTPVRRSSRSRSARRRIISADAELSDDEKENDESITANESNGKLSESNIENSQSRYSLRSRSQQSSLIEKSANITSFDSLYRRSLRLSLQKDAQTPGRQKARQSIFRTPKIKSTISDYTALKKQQKTQWNQDVTKLLKKTWKVCHLSTMINFHYKKPTLKKLYESALRIRILDNYPSYHLTVTIDVSSCISQDSKIVDATIFTITSLIPGETQDDDKTVVVYQTWLFRTDKIQSRALRNAEWFPLMLYSGIETIHRVVIGWLEASFGCYVTPRGFPSNSLLWLAAVWSRDNCRHPKHHPDSDPEMSFQYHLYPSLSQIKFDPPNDRGHSNILIQCHYSIIQDMWLRITNRGDVLNHNQMQDFHTLFGQLVKTVSRIPATLLCLFIIRTPCVNISRDGRVKLLCPVKFAAFLNTLLELFLDSCYTIQLNDLIDEEIHLREEDLT